jgi:hypothetical protein
MAYTVQQVVDQARIPLNDDGKVRYTDAVLLTYFNDSILVIRKKRPDLFLGRWTTLPAQLALADPFPVDDVYVPIVADYITGRAELVDDESVDNSRAATLIQTFMSGLMS